MLKNMQIGPENFTFEPYDFHLMGILNVTPDSFSDGGRFNQLDKALFHTEELIKSGCRIIDIGGESTRPGHTRISDAEEIERTAPIISAVKREFNVAVSVDTYKSAVAEAAMEAGCDLINDIWGLKADPALAAVIARYDAPCVLMHNRDNHNYTNLIPDIIADLNETLALAEKAGIKKDRIILDPGIGFGKDYTQNLLTLKHLADLKAAFDYPWLLGISRKSVIGLTLDLPSEEREEGTAALNTWGLTQGMHFFRIHDAEKSRRSLLMQQAVLKVGE